MASGLGVAYPFAIRHSLTSIPLQSLTWTNVMLAFAIRRLIEAIFVLLTLAVLAFVLFRFVGDP